MLIRLNYYLLIEHNEIKYRIVCDWCSFAQYLKLLQNENINLDSCPSARDFHMNVIDSTNLLSTEYNRFYMYYKKYKK